MYLDTTIAPNQGKWRGARTVGQEAEMDGMASGSLVKGYGGHGAAAGTL